MADRLLPRCAYLVGLTRGRDAGQGALSAQKGALRTWGELDAIDICVGR